MRSRRQWSLVAAGLVLGALAVLGSWMNGGPDRRPNADRREERTAKDQPGRAHELEALKRLPPGSADVPVERYAEALEKMRHLRRYSTARHAVLPSRADAEVRGIYSAAEAGAWTSLGPGNVGGRTRALVIDPRNPRVLYAGGVAGGIWKTTDAGGRWFPLGDSLANIAVSSLVMDPADSRVLYAGTGEGFTLTGSRGSSGFRGAGIFKTRDAGATWTWLTATRTPDFYYVNDLAVSPRDPRRIYAATRTGVWRSTDGGGHWVRLLDPSAPGGCLDLALRTDRPTDVLFAACGTWGQGAVWRNGAAEAGARWEMVLREPGMGRTGLALAPSNQDILYALSASMDPEWRHGLHAVFRSARGGAAGTWTAQVRRTDPTKLNTLLLTNPVNATLEECGFGDSYYGHQGWYNLTIAVDPRDPERVWAGGVDLFRSEDGGRNWGIASGWWLFDGGQPFHSSAVHADQHAIVFHPRYNGTTIRTMYVANDGGVYRTRDARAPVATGEQATCDGFSQVEFESVVRGYGVTQFYFGLPYPDGSAYMGGAQDNGTLRGTDAEGPDAWREISGGDGGWLAIDRDDPRTIYVTLQSRRIYKSTDGGATYEYKVKGITDPASDFLFISPLVMDPSDPKRLWLGGKSLWRTDDGAETWTRASQPVAGSQFRLVSNLAISPSDPDRVLAGTAEGFIHRTSQGRTATGETVWRRSLPRPGYVSWLAFDPEDPDIAYAVYARFGGAHVWKTVDGGVTWEPLDGTAGGELPDVPVHTIAVDPEHRSRLYIGTDVGVFASLDGGRTWMVENTGFANAPTLALSVQTGEGGERNLFAFTHGRGAWRVRLP